MPSARCWTRSRPSPLASTRSSRASASDGSGPPASGRADPRSLGGVLHDPAVGVDLDPDTHRQPYWIDPPYQFDPVFYPVEGVCNTVVAPVTEAGSPVLDALTPITSGVNEIIEGIGL